MSTPTRAGLGITALTFLAGIWIFLSPFIVGYQGDWSDLASPATNSMWTGGILVAISALTILLFAAFALRDAIRSAGSQREQETRADV